MRGTKNQGGGVRRHFSYANVISTLSLFLVIAGGTAVAAKLESNSVRSKSIKDNVVQSKDLKDGKAVGSIDVIDNSLTGADIDESKLTLPASPSSLPPSGAAGGGLAGNYPNPTIAANAVGTAQIADNAVNSAKVAADSLAAEDLAPNSVGQSEIVTDGVGALELAPASVSSDEFETVTDRSAVSTSIADGANGNVSVSCLAGEQILGGGNDSSSISGPFVVASRRSGNSWGVFVRNESGAARTVTVHAYCLAP